MRKEWTPPKSVVICGERIPVKPLKHDQSENYGLYTEEPREIHICPSSIKKGKEHAQSTVKHEMVHAWLDLTGLKHSLCRGDPHLEEGLVRSIEQMLLPALEKLR